MHDQNKWIRRPKGKRNAIRNEVRPGAIPPTCWDDIPNKVSERAYKIGQRIMKNGRIPLQVFMDKFQNKMPRFTAEATRELYYLIIDYRDLV